jgi:glucose-6-phosphate 1-dehydrogenase
MISAPTSPSTRMTMAPFGGPTSIGDQTLFTREDGVERASEAVTPSLERPGSIHTYPAGSWGPAAAEELIAPRRWRLR